MQINIAEDSWHARLFRWYFNLGHPTFLPRSLCPYFWGWVLIVPTLPLFVVLGAPAYLFAWIADDDESLAPAVMAVIGGLGSAFLFIMGAGLFFFVRLCMGYKTEGEWIPIGVDGVILVVTLGFQIHKGFKRWAPKTIYNNYNVWYEQVGRNRQYNTPADWSLWLDDNQPTSFWKVFGEAIKGIYKKACPVINWK